MHAGFAEIDITPPVGTHKIGWIKDIVSDQVLDPLYARVAIFENGDERVAFIQLDTLSIRWTQVNDIRSRIERKHGFPGKHIMVSATHNHAGPAVANCGKPKRDDAYVETLVQKCVEAFGSALSNIQEAEVGFNHVFNFDVAKNRRVVMRDGTVKTQCGQADPKQSLFIEGPIDPELAVLAARDKTGQLLGCLVNYACHPTHHGGETVLSGGYPGVLAREMKRGCPVTLFLNGACGNIVCFHSVAGQNKSMEEVGRILADNTGKTIEGMDFRGDWSLRAASTTLELPYRKVTEAEIKGMVRGAQRFVDPSAYDEGMPGLVARIRNRRLQPVEVQALFMGNITFVGIPAEYFVEYSLRIKEKSYPCHALIVGHANGMVGYVPTRHAFERGGYETTFAMTSRMAPEAGDMLADAAIELIGGHKVSTNEH